MVILEFLTKIYSRKRYSRLRVRFIFTRNKKNCSGVWVGLLYCLILHFPGMSKCVALLTIPHLLREDATKIFDGIDNKQPSIEYWGIQVYISYINLSGNASVELFAIKVEDFTIASTKDFIHTFSILITSRYLFNLLYTLYSSA